MLHRVVLAAAATEAMPNWTRRSVNVSNSIFACDGEKMRCIENWSVAVGRVNAWRKREVGHTTSD